MIIDCISDLHGYYPKLEGGDLLIVAGDLTARDTKEEFEKFIDWLAKQKYEKIIVIGGNHDNVLRYDDNLLLFFSGLKMEYLCDSGIEFEGLKIWGSPWTLKFPRMNPHCMAFTCDTEDELYDKFEKIPHDTDILITHIPPFGIHDNIPLEDGTDYHAGSKALYNWLKYVERPLLHIFGHIHEGYGQSEVFASYNDKMMISVNASHVNEHYEPVNKPIRIEL